jgi:hypothetical protein
MGLEVTASVVEWSEFLGTDPEVWVQFPTIPDFLRSSRPAELYKSYFVAEYKVLWRRREMCIGYRYEIQRESHR